MGLRYVLDARQGRRAKSWDCNAGSVPAEEFRALADLLAAAPPKVSFGQLSVMQLGYAAAAALEGTAAARWARLAQLEQDIIHLSANGVLLLVHAPLRTLTTHAESAALCYLGTMSNHGKCVGNHAW